MIAKFEATFHYKLIYIIRINDDRHNKLVKIGDATVHTDSPIDALTPNCKELNQAAKKRIDEYTRTAGIAYELLHTELAVYQDRDGKLKAFIDKKVHKVLERSGLEKYVFRDKDVQGKEWFKTDLETAKKAILAVKNNKSSLDASEITTDLSPIEFRPEQRKAIDKTIKFFKHNDAMLWNAKMRFGKTVSALQVVKEMGFKKTLIYTHRPEVNSGWFDDFKKIFYDTNYKLGSKTFGEEIENLEAGDTPFVYFASIQDLRGSKAVGGKFEKNEYIFLIDWDLVVIDEAHEGTQTKLGQNVQEAILDAYPGKKPKLLELSGTPFNLLENFNADQIYTWDYVMEQQAKKEWDKLHLGDSNPYEDLPELKMYVYDLNKIIKGYADLEDKAFNFKEFFRVWTGDLKKDTKPVPQGVKIGSFVHEKDVRAFLDLLTKKDDSNNFPFSTEEYRSYFKHTLWVVPGVKEAKALSALLKRHAVFSQFEIVNVAGDGDEEIDFTNAQKMVKEAIGDDPDASYTITVSCTRLTTGVTIPEWTAVLMLYGSFNTLASRYLQTAFRVQNPANINGRVKESCAVFDFAPDRTLKMVAEAGHLSLNAGNVSNDRDIMGEFLNYCPVIAVNGATMKKYDVGVMLQQLKRAYTDRVVKNGFDDKNIYNENLMKLDNLDLKDFEDLKAKIGSTKQTKAPKDIDVNKQGFTNEEYELLKKAEKKEKKELTPEEQALLEKKKEVNKNADNARKILRGISIRIPLLIYGADIPFDTEITVDNFVDIVDDNSWEEFMPSGVTKDDFKKFSKYYEQDVFIGAGRRIRNMAKSADELDPTERVKRIADIFTMFKNPDKETVLTPWRVVNMHMSDCLGGYNFFNEEFTDTLDEPVFVDRGKVTKDIFQNKNVQVLEINSKTGLYPLYVTYSIFRHRMDTLSKEDYGNKSVWDIWKETVEQNVFIVCKTKMAKSIINRTLLGYKDGKINAHAFDDLIMQLKSKPEQFKEKVLKGSTWNKENKDMKFDAVVGNPPYHETDGGGIGDSATPVYNKFVEMAKKVSSNYMSLIMPSRWMKGGKGLSQFREAMMKDLSLKIIFDYADAGYCFQNIHIDGGVCYLLWDKYYHGKTEYHYKDLNGIVTLTNRFLQSDVSGTIIRDARQISIIEKASKNGEQKFNKIVSTRNPYGLFADLFNSPNKYKNIIWSEDLKRDFCVVYGVKGIKGGARRIVGYINKSCLKKENDSFSMFKLFFSKAYMTTSTIPPEIILAKPNEVCTETFLQIGSFNNEIEARNCLKYIKAKFFRALLFFNRSSLNISNETFSYIPLQDFTNNGDIDWTKSVSEIDQQLYKKYNLSADEIAYIEANVKPMD